MNKLDYIIMKKEAKNKLVYKLETLEYFKRLLKDQRERVIVYFVDIEDDYSSFEPQRSEVAMINLDGKVLFNDVIRANSVKNEDKVKELERTLRMAKEMLLITFSSRYAQNGGMISIFNSEVFLRNDPFDLALEYTYAKDRYSYKGDVYLVPSVEKMMNELEYSGNLDTCLDKAKAIASVCEKVLVFDIEKYKSRIADIEDELKAIEDGRIVFN